ncbi:MAG: hypothetical protein JWQ25_378 [Daejeonella sp.]|nr:hypothetical protein [Daejeonella sp.]
MAYQFHAWARKSIASLITTPDDLGLGSAPPDVRVRVAIDVEVAGKTVTKNFSVASPGDIIGVRQEMIVRTDPRPNSGDFEPNYFPSIEFYDEDFPWRYTPATAVGDNQSQLRPWLMLIVLNEEDFVKTKRQIPLSSIMVKDASVLPSNTELHLWAHVHSNFGDPDTPLEDLIGSLRTKSETDPDGLFSRVICPRKLEEDVLYHAFLVPAFEAGRLAGLDLPSETTPAQQSAWTDASLNLELPVYYRWQFRTGANADFETLLRLMQPRPDLDPKVGIQDLDCTHPGYIKTEQSGEVPAPNPAVLGMCGAVKQLSTVPVQLQEPVKDQPFVQEIKKHLDLVVQSENLTTDPIVTIPFYGFHHAKTVADLSPDFKPELGGWAHAINRDPRNRAAAALGTMVVQAQQEKFMQSAWAQLPRINEINRSVKELKLIMEVNGRLLQSTFQKQTVETGKVLAMARPASTRIKETNSAKTVFQTITESQIPNGTVSSNFRRLSRPNGSVARKLNVVSTFSAQGVFNKVNQPTAAREVKTVPVTWFNDFSEMETAKATFTPIPGTAFMKTTERATVAIKPRVGGLEVADFPGRGTVIDKGTITLSDTAVAQNVFLKTQQVVSFEIPEPSSTIQITASFQETVIDNLNPAKTLLPRFIACFPGLPKPPKTREEVLPVMAHPDFPEAVYQHLAAINQDFIVPNLSLVPPNTIALMEPNFDFIHSFLVGLNHEMSRELLWREYPTDQRGTYFRQFWDPGGNRSPEQQNLTGFSYKDIVPITKWGNDTRLDDFFKISKPLPSKPLVLLLKGDLLKKYPNTVIFAQKATIADNKLVLNDSSPEVNFKFPLFTGNLAPDVRLLGFDLSVAQARGTISQTDGTTAPGNEGWFFVLAEVPGEPRFGLDITYAPPSNGEKNTWDNLSFEDIKPGELFILGKEAPLNTHGNWPNDGTEAGSNNDLEKWGRSSADMAGILLQKPAMMAIHGDELLKSFKN